MRRERQNEKIIVKQKAADIFVNLSICGANDKKGGFYAVI